MATDSGQQDDGSAALKPFGSVEYCPKCGTATYDAATQWMPSKHILVTCKCGFAWGEQPLDGENA